MTRKLQKDRQGVATCQQRVFRNQMENLFLSLSSSISLWPRYFCSLKSLVKLRPFHSCASKKVKKTTKKHIAPYKSLVFLLMFKIMLCFVKTHFCRPKDILFATLLSHFPLHLIPFPYLVSFQHSFVYLHSNLFFSLPCLLNNSLHCFQILLLL